MARQPLELEDYHARVLAGIGTALRVLKAKFGTQREIADRLGVHENALSRWKRGAADVPAGKLVELFELAGVSMDEAFGLHGRVGETQGMAGTATMDSDYVIERVLAAAMRLASGKHGESPEEAALPSSNLIGREERERAVENLRQCALAGLASVKKGKA
jgi:transcriptional regulator with XRE-family HTH domain